MHETTAAAGRQNNTERENKTTKPNHRNRERAETSNEYTKTPQPREDATNTARETT